MGKEQTGLIVNKKYRPEIDGLRAFAVVTVIINHFNKNILPGGYLGVDIFFVISGYVITSSLCDRQSYSFKDFISGFYERRLKRLVPALLFFVLITSIAICLFNPLPILTLKTGLTSLFGVSNVFLYIRSTDYFAESTALNTFTHTWSLGVEEQFYFIFPLLIWFSGFGRQTKHGARNLFFTVGALTIASLIGFIYLNFTNQPAAYFLMPSRFWEMAVGCLIFIGFQKQTSIKDFIEKIPNILILGFIVGVMYLPISLSTTSTIAVVALSSILIATIKKQTAVFKLFANPKIVYIGLISYSLYLWHWGVLSISRWTIGVHWWTVPFQIAFIFGIAIFSYRWIETPMRKGDWFGKRWKNLLFGGGILVILSGGIGTLLIASKESGLYLGNALTATGDDYSEYFTATRHKCNKVTYTRNKCFAYSKYGNSQSVLLFGDSHAGHIIPLMGELYYAYDINTNISIFGDYPELIQENNQGISKIQDKKNIDLKSTKFNELINSMKYGDIVILSSRWEHHLHEDAFNIEDKSVRKLYSDEGLRVDHEEAVEIFGNKLRVLSNRLESKGIKLVVFAPLPVFRGAEDPPPTWACSKEWFRPFINSNCSQNFQEERDIIENRVNSIRKMLFKAETNQNNLYIYDPFDQLCPSKTICTTTIESKKYFRDDDHLSRDGAIFLMNDFQKFLRNRKILEDKKIP